jgi:phage terminase large subunit-like protein
VGATLRDVREVMVEGPSGMLSLPGRERPQWESSRRRLRWRNGAVAHAFSAEEPERLRGPQFEAAWADEFCAWHRPEKALSNLRLCLRRGPRPQLVVTTTPRPIASLRRLRDEVSCVITQAGTAVNEANLAPTFVSGLTAIYGGTSLAKQELEGVLLEGDGALWTRARLAAARGERPAKFDRVVVGVDPPAGVEGAACGIVVAGQREGRGYVLADFSVAGLTPNGWALRAAAAAREFGALKIIAEGNQGGEMVRSTLEAAQVPCRVDIVHASVGKRARAEPVSALYEQGRVTHCGEFSALEQEMLELGIGEAREGLDRADALVWALTHLLVVKPPVTPKIIDLWAT